MATTSSVRRQLMIGARLVVAWRPTGAALINLVRSLVTSFVALGVAFYVLPGKQSSGPGAIALLVVVVAAVGLLLRPLLLGLTVLLGSFGILVAGVLAQAAILAVAIALAPDVHTERWTTVLGAAWIATVVGAGVNWLLDSGSQDAYHAQVLGRVVRIAHRLALEDGPVGEPGMVVVQLDGVGATLLRQAIVAGTTPTLARWIRTGSHRAYRWHTGLPATTPAGQAVLLHGDDHVVPSFRWYDKSLGRLVVANHPGDAHAIEAAMSTGRGLLADGGVSVSNLFSGDAPTRILTMSDAKLPARSRGLASFATTSVGLVRTIVLFVGQVIVETYQARRQKQRDVRPRVERSRVFALLRGVTTALLHDLNVAIVAEQMARGAPVIFVDFVDFDEIAHHAGPARPESVRTLDGLDQVLEFVARVATEANRSYELVIVSDHGQAQGEPFDQLTGRTLDELVATLCDDDATGATTTGAGAAEQWGNANVLLTGAARSSARALGRLARRKADAPDCHPEQMTVSLGSRATRASATARSGTARSGTARSGTARSGTARSGTARSDAATHTAPHTAANSAPIVASSGSLAHIYLPDVAGRATREEIERRHPDLLAGLAATEGVGAVVVRGEDGSLQAHGRRGWRALNRPGGAGTDPLSTYGPLAAADLLQLDTREHVGDLVVLGRYDPDILEVAAFEELVGSHGGLGGDQTTAVLAVPASWPAIALDRPCDDSGALRPLTGLEVHAALVARLRELGLRPGDERRADAPVAVG